MAVPQWSSVLVYEVGQQGALVGPMDSVVDAEQVSTLPKLGYSHFAYVCFK